MKESYIFPAVFCMDDKVKVSFPDLSGCSYEADSLEMALRQVKETLSVHLYEMEVAGLEIPVATPVLEIKPVEKEIVIPVEVFMAPVRDKMNMKTVSTTLTIPRWILNLAKENNVNISGSALRALKEDLGIAEYEAYYQAAKAQDKKKKS